LRLIPAVSVFSDHPNEANDGREVEAKITKIVDSVAGRKIHIAYGLIALKIDPEQIIREVR
jgi:hypothetical protein